MRWRKKIGGTEQRIQVEPPRGDDLALTAVRSTFVGSSCILGSNVLQETPHRGDDPALTAVKSTLTESSCSNSVSEIKRRPPKMRACFACQVLLPSYDFVNSQWRPKGKCISCVESITRNKRNV